MTVRMDAWPDFFLARLPPPEGAGGGIGVAPTCAPNSDAYPPSGGISPYLAWCISLALAPVEATPSKPEKVNPRPPAGALPRLAATRQSRRNCDLASRRSPARRLRLSLLRSLCEEWKSSLILVSHDARVIRQFEQNIRWEELNQIKRNEAGDYINQDLFESLCKYDRSKCYTSYSPEYAEKQSNEGKLVSVEEHMPMEAGTTANF